MSQICCACGQKIRKLNSHVMDRQKVRVLELLAKSRIAGAPWVKVEEGTRMLVGDQILPAPYRARAHASRLVWFGLAEHGDHRSGLYAVTDAGLAFLTGQTTVPAKIFCKDGRVVEESPERVRLQDVRGLVLDKPYWDQYVAQQRYRIGDCLDLFGARVPDSVR